MCIKCGAARELPASKTQPQHCAEDMRGCNSYMILVGMGIKA
jgi:hypothetical protein